MTDGHKEPQRTPPSALAAGDFSAWIPAFSHAGFDVSSPGEGVLQICGSPASRPCLLLSVGVHGDETAPIEMLARLLDEVAQRPGELAVDLLVVVANPQAIALKRRFVDADLNRMFRSPAANGAATVEAARAFALMKAAADFFEDASGERTHLDLHTAIRASLYPAFSLVPAAVAEAGQQALTGWLGGAGIEAVVINGKPAGTFSAFTAEHFGANSATLELGRIGELGKNDLAPFEGVFNALLERLRGNASLGSIREGRPIVFDVSREIIKRSDGFQLMLDRSVSNFTALEKGEVIARDGNDVYRVEESAEYVLFPNPDVAVGQRAALMLTRREQ